MDQANEEKILDFWKKNDTFKKALAKRRNGKKFYFCDGPPFATGGIHLGTAWNKALKDAVIRFRLLQGYRVYARAGYDAHGLPIETQVEKELGVKDKKEIEKEVGLDKFITKCRQWVDRYIKLMNEQFLRLGVWMDFDDPYITYSNDYIEKSWATFKKAHERGFLVNGIGVNPHCPRCQTTMANYELEYHEMTDPSIYVKFKIDGKENEYLIVWTTTPWTLIGNVAVMANPLIKYVKVKADEEVWIFAKDLTDRLQKISDKNFIVAEEFAGKELAKLKYAHPFAKEIGKTDPQPVVMSDEFVTTEEGSGLVHCAPGHGPEDYIIGKRYELPIFSPVGPDGKYTEEAGEFAGKRVLEINDEIIKELKKKGTLVKSEKITHRYPQCWRCKTKLIHISSNQWFITVTKVKEKMTDEIRRVMWVPPFAGVWFNDFVSSARDWCISRQRYWGIPLPIWKCDKCEEIIVIGSVKELGKDAKDIELHRPYVDKITLKCQKCEGTMHRIPDVLDVWFDSGNAVWAGLRKGDEEFYPADLIVEGKDQIRGWFYSLLGEGVILNDEVPYRSLIMHGYVVDEKGAAMHKSLGNFVSWEEVIGKYPADVVRLWTLSNTVWDDLRFSWKELDEAKRELAILWNIGTYVERFYKPAEKKKMGISIEDAWLLSKMNTLTKEVTESMEKGETHAALKRIRRFVVNDLSRFYLKLIKKKEDIETLYNSYLNLLILIAPFIPFTAESLYRKLYEKDHKEESLFLLSWPTAEKDKINELLEKRMENVRDIVELSNAIRADEEIKLRWPVEEIVVVTRSTDITESVKHLENIILAHANIKKIVVDDQTRIELDEKGIVKEFGQKIADEVIKLKENENALFRGVTNVDGRDIDFGKYLSLKRKGYGSKIAAWGAILLKTEISEELKAEGLLSEVRRRIQIMRKEIGLVEKDKINVHISGSKLIKEIIEAHGEMIKGEINAKELTVGTGGKHKKTWDVEEENVTIGIDVL